FSSHARATTSLSTLSLHDALPILSAGNLGCRSQTPPANRRTPGDPVPDQTPTRHRIAAADAGARTGEVRLGDRRRVLWPQRRLRSEEHTSELQSLTNLVCRLLLQK